MECYKKKNSNNGKKINRMKPYDQKVKDYNVTRNTANNGEYNMNRSKTCEEENKDHQTFQSLYAPAAKRLLSSRYPLTKDGKKYIEIGICLKNKLANIEIAIGEVFKNEVVFNINEWKNLIEYIHVIQEHVKSKATTTTIIPLCKINDCLTIEVCKYKDMNLIYFIQNKHSIILSLETVLSLLYFNDCIYVHHEDLTHMIGPIDVILAHEIKEEEEDYLEYDKSNKLICELCATYPFVRNKYGYV